jgi:multidrug efflux pump subunit AcrB
MLAEFAVRRWQFTMVMFIALCALGGSALFSIPKAEDPNFPFPMLAVIAVLPGSTPSDMERLVVDPLETRFKTLDDVKNMKTEIEDGLAVIQVEFQSGVDPVQKHDDLLREMNAVRPSLPAELVRLEVRKFDAALTNIITLGLTSETASYRELDRYARALKRRLESLPGVGDVELAGLPRQEVAVALDLPRMVQLGVSTQEVMVAIGADAQNVPAGTLDAGARRFNIKTSGDYTSIEEIRNTVVRMSGSATLRLRDIADVQLQVGEASQIARLDGKPAVLLAAAQKDGENIYTVTEHIDAALRSFSGTLPTHIQLARGFEQVQNVSRRMDGFARDFALAIALVLFTLLPLGTRASLVVMITIPLSLAIGLLVLQVTGFSINQMSVVGFVIALGLLVDDSVVVVENITRHLRQGLPPRAAAVAGTRQITASVVGCTATLIFAFVPLLALPGIAGQYVRSMPLAIVFTILASLLVSLSIVPFLSSVLLKPQGAHGNVFLRALNWTVEGSYRRVLERALRHPVLTLVVALGLFAGSLALIPSIGFSLFPKAGVPQFLVRIETAEGASLSETDRAARFVEGVLARHPEISRVTTSVGKGHPRVYYNTFPSDEKSNFAEVLAQAKARDVEQRAAFYTQLRDELTAYPGARIELFEFANGPPIDAPVAFRLLGDDESELEAVALRVQRVLLETDGTRDVRNRSHERRTDLRLRIDRERAALLGIAVPDIDRAVRLALGGVPVGKYREQTAEEAYDIKVALPHLRPMSAGASRPGLEALELLRLPTPTGAVPLSQVAQLELDPSPTKLRHYDKERCVTVTAQVRDGYNTDRVTKHVLVQLSKLPLPAGVRIMPAGEIESREESFKGIGTALLLAAFGVLAILVLEFRTFKSTLIVASVIPLGVIGGLVALYATGNTLSFTSSIGFVALIGIEVKNSILLVDFTGQLRARGVPLMAAIAQAGETRFVPILLTTLTAIGGLLPLALENSSLYSPLALVILGGLISSTVLTRVVTPIVYMLLAPELGSESEAEPDALIAGAPVEA